MTDSKCLAEYLQLPKLPTCTSAKASNNIYCVDFEDSVSSLQ